RKRSSGILSHSWDQGRRTLCSASSASRLPVHPAARPVPSGRGDSGDVMSSRIGWLLRLVVFFAALVPAASAHATLTQTFSIPAGQAADSLRHFAAQAD